MAASRKCNALSVTLVTPRALLQRDKGSRRLAAGDRIGIADYALLFEPVTPGADPPA